MVSFFQPTDSGKRFFHLPTRQVGRLESFPLHDRGSLTEGEAQTHGVLWIPDFTDRTEEEATWLYVDPNDVEPLQE